MSINTETEIVIYGLDGGNEFRMSISRQIFDKLIQPFVDKSIRIIQKLLKDNSIDKSDIEYVILVGGSTRIPYVQCCINNFFGTGLKHTANVNPDTSVAMGACIWAGQKHYAKKEFERSALVDCTTFSLGVALDGGVFDAVIAKGTPIPFEASRTYYTGLSAGRKYCRIRRGKGNSNRQPLPRGILFKWNYNC